MSKENERDRIVQLLAVNPKYKNRTGYIVPVYNSTERRYEVGIEKLPKIEQGKILSALGVSNDPEKGLQIDEIQIPIAHRQRLDLKRDEDYGIYCMCLVSDLVAKSSKTVDSKKHLFFVNDIESEATEDITIEKKRFEAKKLIFDEADMLKLRSMCIFLGGIDIRNLSLNALMARSLKEAELRPDEVISFYSGGVENKVFILELYHYGVLQHKQGKYYDGEVFLGTLSEAIDYVVNPKNSSHVNSLGTRLLEKKKG